MGIESAKANVQTVAAMKGANQELKKTMKHDLNIDDVEDLADDMAELMDEFNEINEALGQNFATPDDIDEADLDAELELLEDELFEEEKRRTPRRLTYKPVSYRIHQIQNCRTRIRWTNMVYQLFQTKPYYFLMRVRARARNDRPSLGKEH